MISLIKLKSYLLGLLLLTAASCSQQQSADAQALSRSTAGGLPSAAQAKGLAVATLAGGCFWCTEEVFEELKGVHHVVSGYAGGKEANPTYQQVGSGSTSHAESFQVYYDPKQISYQQLLDVFFLAAHDPTTLNRQGPDAGAQYRSVAFYRTPQEKQLIEATIKRVNASRHYPNPIVTQVAPFTAFWPAEDYHQGYFRLHPTDPYVQSVSTPKVLKFRKAFPQLLKSPL
ncbi:peptide-methionine (S)-S-oxide reductase MsrA [Hymenobacter psychrotolerans]|uniref:Peptide methionine sulfoxide reductase MsrA n=1 Tax=Hymenobacter psychrotolerans DSM 18569 TaxID=1121959 RepID=A0A1M7BVE5_9BACT|nr:peptide-methionine (S)-S-oxide reductase MsrA [Hymenobacter psychrotolerans]SHL58836.1 peptide-methionine (S)-S-oxide reductase [Hymenobacter psychrotolerans DSM 18569]